MLKKSFLSILKTKNMEIKQKPEIEKFINLQKIDNNKKPILYQGQKERFAKKKHLFFYKKLRQL